MPLYYPPTQNGLQKTLDAGLDTGVTASLTLNNVTGIQNKPGVFVVDRIDTDGNEKAAALREFISFTGTSGVTLTGLTRALGGSTDQDHATGAVVEFIPDVVWAQALNDVITAEHSVAGVHDNTKVAAVAGAAATTLTVTGATNVTLPTTGTLATLAGTKALTNKTLTNTNNTVAAKSLHSATTVIDVVSATAPTSGQVLTATAGTTATWQTPSAAALSSKVKQFTRDIAGSNGDVSYTGIGFVPTSIIFSYMTTDGKCVGTGMVDSAKGMNSYFSAQQAGYTSADSATDKCIYLSNQSGTNQQALLKTYDADGFTLTWNKTSTPTGTAHIVAICYK